MEIKVLGTGCAKCKALEERTREAVNSLGVNAEIIKVTDVSDIMEYDVMITPALVVNENVKSFSRVPSVEEIKAWLQKMC